MIIWRGLGFLVAVIIFVCSLLANFLSNAIAGSAYYDHHKWPFAVSLVVAAAIVWPLGNYLRKRSDKIVIEKDTGKEITLNQSKHALFFIPMHFWGPIILVLALIAIVMEFVNPVS